MITIKIKSKVIKTTLKILILISIIIFVISMFIIIKRKNETRLYNIEEIIGTRAKYTLKVQDQNGDICYIPKGFKISDKVSEQEIVNGLVIVDDTNDKETNGSEFVWIPVESSSLDEFNEKFKTYIGYEFDTFDTDFVNCINQTRDNTEYAKVLDSIYKYKGFYIARYEAGISNLLEEKLKEEKLIKNNIITEDITRNYATGKYKPVSKKNSIVWNFTQWGNDLESEGAVKVAKSMYKSKKTTAKSTLCYGAQWDAILNFIDNNYYKECVEYNSVIINSNTIGNYSENILNSGQGLTKIKNIYDLAGNLAEWTMEEYSDNMKITRGGSSRNKLNISSRQELYPNNSYIDVGFRVALYIKCK